MKAKCLAFALAAIALAAASPARAAYAIAWSASEGRGAADNSSFDTGDARKRALSKCGRGCSIVASGKGSCAAVVSSGRGQPWAVATGTTTSTAANSAWHGCRRKGGVNCETAVSICD